MNEIDIVDWLESRVPVNDSEMRLRSLATSEIMRLRKRVIELEYELAERNTESKGLIGTHE